MATINVIIFHFFSVATFTHRRSAQKKNLILRKLTGVPKNIDSISHFGATRLIFVEMLLHLKIMTELGGFQLTNSTHKAYSVGICEISILPLAVHFCPV